MGLALGALWLALRGPGTSSEDATTGGPETRQEAVHAPLDGVAAAPASSQDATLESVRAPAAQPSAPAATAPARSAEVEPERRKGLFLRALGPDGAPVPNASLEWVFRSRMGDVRPSPIRGVTDGDGVLEVEDGEEFVERYLSEGPHRAFFSAVGVRCAMPFEELNPTDDDPTPGVTWVEGEPAPGTVLEVEVPPYGFVHFTWDAPDAPRGGKLHPSWIVVRRSDGEHFPGWRFGGALEGEASGFTFGPVGLGWEVWGALSVTGSLEQLGRGSGAGPTRAGETAEIALTAEPEHRDLVALAGSLTAASGPFRGPHRSAYLTLGAPGAKKARRKSVRLDEEGRFELVLPRSAVPGALTARVGKEEDALEGSRALPPLPAEERVLDVGEVRLKPLPTEPELPSVALAAGRVVDTAGRPVEGARVYVHGKATQVGERTVSADMFSSLGSARVGADGLFDISAAAVLASESIGVRVQAPGYIRPRSVGVQAGAGDVDFVLERGADVRVTLRVHDLLLMTESLSFRIGNCAQEFQRDGASIGGDRRASVRPLLFRGVPVGSHVFEVDLSGSDWPAIEVPVEVTDPTLEVDLGVVDLSDAYRFCPLRLVDGDGAPIAGSYIDVVADRDGDGRSYRLRGPSTDDQGHVTLTVPKGVSRLRVALRGTGGADVPPEALSPPPAGDETLERTTVVLVPE